MATDANRPPRRPRAGGRDATTARRAGSARGSGAAAVRESPEQPSTAEAEPELDERKTAILNAVVSEYIDSAQPVGSGHVTGSPGVDVSSATVRSEMAALEREGYLVQPHTSAGRIPTDKGYRFFVDHLGRTGTLGPHQRHEVRKFFAHVHGEVEELLGHTSGLLADLTNYAAVVVGPGHESAAIRSVQLVGLSPGLALVVVVLADGAVEKRTIEVPTESSADVLAAAASHLSAHVNGTTLKRLGAVPEVGDVALRAVVERGLAALADLAAADESDHVYVGGSSRMAAAFDAVETVRSVLSILEQQLVVVELIEDILDRGLSVAIGTEHGFEPLAACALVVAPVAVDGELAGTIGVVGPTRMHYPRALAAVELVGEQLGARLTGTGPAPAGSRTESDARRSRAAPAPARGRRGGSRDGD
ncbi:MAG TPA: heat-inducible transcriptional repressor HrcA [Acidimicrobiales bacterium]|nr:heat-inducible transcriptional repressor HrcA [Acidimicrobiales bacterium]